MKRIQLVEQVAHQIAATKRTHPFRVAIDGVDAAGKTTLANELVGPLEKRNRPVIRASIDGFHNPRLVRYRRGKDSPEGYFYDSFDLEALKTYLLKPLGPGGNGQYQTAVFDFRTDSRIFPAKQQAQANSILLFDGVFLLRPEHIGCWDFTVFLDVDFDVVIERAARRDLALFGSAEQVRERYRTRYIPGQKIYLNTCQPRARADVLIDNNDLMNPRIR